MHGRETGLTLASIFSGWYLAGGDGTKAAVKGTKIARYAEKLVSQVAAAQRKVKGLEDHVRKSAAASKYWASKRGEAYRKLQEDLKKCNSRHAVRKRSKNTRMAGQNIPREGKWSGEPGNSKWTPEPGSPAEQALKDYKQTGVEYRNGKPDFSPFLQKGRDGQSIEAHIPDMQGNHAARNGDFGQARTAMKNMMATGMLRKWKMVIPGTTMKTRLRCSLLMSVSTGRNMAAAPIRAVHLRSETLLTRSSYEHHLGRSY